MVTLDHNWPSLIFSMIVGQCIRVVCTIGETQRESTWSFISEIKGETIATLPSLPKKSPKAKGSRAKQRLLPLLVGRLTKTSLPSKKLVIALFCWLFKEEKPKHLLAFLIDASIARACTGLSLPASQCLCSARYAQCIPGDIKQLLQSDWPAKILAHRYKTIQAVSQTLPPRIYPKRSERCGGSGLVSRLLFGNDVETPDHGHSSDNGESRLSGGEDIAAGERFAQPASVR